ncbi:MAG: DUF4062 domain-containing protein [Nitrospirales bacterium]|nr:DUF4062 domain-containing protein [Nitrospirales bacterium]
MPEGLRQSGLVILILGKEYGQKQQKGISATHEEHLSERESSYIGFCSKWGEAEF